MVDQLRFRNFGQSDGFFFFGFSSNQFGVSKRKKKTQTAMKNEEQARSLFGISLSDKPKWKQFLICSSGFFFGYLVNGICEVFFSPLWLCFFLVETIFFLLLVHIFWFMGEF